MNDMQNKIFHGICLNNNCKYKENISDIDVFEDILKTGKILTRNELYKTNNKIVKHLEQNHGQRLDKICLAMHPKTDFFYSDEPLEDAFYNFIRFNISFIFNANITKNEDINFIFGIPGEIRFPHSINLQDNLIGIGYFDEIEYVINKINKGHIGEFDSLYHNLKYCKNVESYVDTRKEKLYIIKDILEKYKYFLPIVDPLSGNKINDDRNEDIDKVNKILYKIYKKNEL